MWLVSGGWWLVLAAVDLARAQHLDLFLCVRTPEYLPRYDLPRPSLQLQKAYPMGRNVLPGRT